MTQNQTGFHDFVSPPLDTQTRTPKTHRIGGGAGGGKDEPTAPQMKFSQSAPWFQQYNGYMTNPMFAGMMMSPYTAMTQMGMMFQAAAASNVPPTPPHVSSQCSSPFQASQQCTPSSTKPSKRRLHDLVLISGKLSSGRRAKGRLMNLAERIEQESESSTKIPRQKNPESLPEQKEPQELPVPTKSSSTLSQTSYFFVQPPTTPSADWFAPGAPDAPEASNPTKIPYGEPMKEPTPTVEMHSPNRPSSQKPTEEHQVAPAQPRKELYSKSSVTVRSSLLGANQFMSQKPGSLKRKQSSSNLSAQRAPDAPDAPDAPARLETPPVSPEHNEQPQIAPKTSLSQEAINSLQFVHQYKLVMYERAKIQKEWKAKNIEPDLNALPAFPAAPPLHTMDMDIVVEEIARSAGVNPESAREVFEHWSRVYLGAAKRRNVLQEQNRSHQRAIDDEDAPDVKKTRL